ncbi:MAG: ABC transporter ATP-binding protein [Treponema sp.]|nr:ABC transporter ATP-binding protein [Treponema sp.]
MLKWIWSYIRKYRIPMAVGLIFSVIVAGFGVVNPLISGSIVDNVINSPSHDFNLLVKLVLLMVGATLLKAIIRYSYQVIFEHCSQNVIREMREDLYAHIQTLDFAWYDKAPSGNVLTLLTSDLDKVRHFVAWVLYQSMENSLIYIFSIITLGMINWKLMLAFFAIAPFVLFLVQKFKINIRPAHMKVRDQFAVLNTRVGENIEGNRVVKAFVRENYEIGKFDNDNDGYRKAAVNNADVRVKYTPWIDTLCGLLPVILILFGGYLVINHEMTIGQLVTFNGLMWAFTQPIQMFGMLVDNIQNFGASGDRLYELWKTKPSVKKGFETIDEAHAVSSNVGAENDTSFVPVEGRVEFKNVTFAYNQVPVIKNMSFKIEPGMTVGILGPTGSGKSTIANLMCRYYDVSEGAVLIDGKDVRDYVPETLRKNIGITMQEAFLFSDTVEGNIAFGNQNATFEEVEHAAELARVKEFIGDLTDGYDTIVGERGVGLSGGQKQRIALARLFLANPKIMILDDTTSAVDIETEQKIRQSIKEQSKGHTTFIISHRISSFESCDLVLVIQDGQIAAMGTNQELLNQPGYYRDVYLEQNGLTAVLDQPTVVPEQKDVVPEQKDVVPEPVEGGKNGKK